MMSIKRKQNVNNMNGTSNGGASFGRDGHAPQVTPGRHHTTAMGNSRRIATWNIRSMYQSGKMDNIIMEMKRLNISIMGVCEVRWTGAGKLQSDDVTFIYSCGEKHQYGVGVFLDKECAQSLCGFWCISERIVMIRLRERPLDITVIQCYAPTAECSEEEIEKFYQQLDQAVSQCKSQDIRVVMGDLNAKVGEGKRRNIVGNYGLGEVNDRGEMFIEWCEANKQVITNTWFKQHPRNLYTWRSPGDRYRNQIDYITINSRFRNAIKSARTYPGADCDTDHILLVCRLQLKLGKMVAKKSTPRPDLKLLRTSKDVRSQFFDSVAGKYENAVTGSKDPWTAFEEIVISSTEECVPKAKRIGKQKWMTEEILEKMEERRKLQKNSPEYKQLNKEIRRKCKEEKEKSLEKECEDIEDLCKKDQQMMYEKVRKVTFKNKRACTGCIKEEDGTIVTDQDQIRRRWTEYVHQRVVRR